ncbi:MAG: SDR family oxidoreductase [Novosphingobium sp.]|nr:SDR family oxidoreductase [Novosphingobium sp.]
MQLEGKVVLVTGGGGGIGAGMAEAFVERGARVAISDFNLDFARAEAERIGGGSIALAHDVTDLASWAAVKREIEGQLGPVEVLCNNAGIAVPFMPLEEIAPEAFARLLAVNVTGVYNGVRTFVPEMKARGAGHLVNTSSLNGLLPYATSAAYSATKFAVAGMSEALSIELAPFGIGVSILYPGLTRSRMSERHLPGADAAAMLAMRARMMEPVWLGRAVVRAVEENTLHIITHPDHRPALEARFDAILAAHGEPAQPDYAGGRLTQA